MRQVIALVDPTMFSPRDGPTPHELLTLAAESDYGEELVGALIDAAAARADGPWRVDAALFAAKHRKSSPAELGALLAALGPDQREAALMGVAAQSGLVAWQKLELFATCDHALSEAFTRIVVETVAEALTMKGLGVRYAAPEALDALSRRVEPRAALPIIEQLIAASKGDLIPSVAAPVNRIRFRADLHKEFEA